MIISNHFSKLVTRQRIGLVLGPSLFLLLFVPFDISSSANAALASTLWIAAEVGNGSDP